MIYALITIGAFIAIITTSILKSVTNESKYKVLKRLLIVVISLAIYVGICLFVLSQNPAIAQ
jgi:hypothetical protein